MIENGKKNQDVEAWQSRLLDNFSTDGIVGGRYLTTIMEMEQHAGSIYTHKFRGQDIASNAFQEFFSETVDTAIKIISQNGWPKDDENYPLFFSYLVTLLRQVRASDVLVRSGYPWVAFTIQRSQKELAFALGALMNNSITFRDYQGLPPELKKNWEEADHEKSRKARISADRIINEIMFGDKSGLSKEDQAEMLIWHKLFNAEVHRSMYSMINDTGGFMFSRKPYLSIGPVFDDGSCVMYMNREAEIGWMITRLLPFLQLENGHFGADWAKRWTVMDTSLHALVLSLDDLGKRIARTMERFVTAKFPFSPDDKWSQRE